MKGGIMTRSVQGPTRHPEVGTALMECRRAFSSIAVFSAVVNILMLAGPLYMLQIYDRVLASRSVPTLVALTIFLVGALAFQGILDVIRSRIVVRAAALLDRRLATIAHAAVMQFARARSQPGDAQQPVRDLDQIRSFLTSAGPVAIVDLPWVPAFLLICFLIHMWLGVLALMGALILLLMTALTERASRLHMRELRKDANVRAAMLEADRRNSESAIAMGMSGMLGKRWEAVNDQYVTTIGKSSDVVGAFGSTSKVLRLLLQSLMLGLGAFLVIRQELTAGSMIAAAIMMGRALAPIDTAIANWRGFVGARDSIRRLSDTLSGLPRITATIELPKPSQSLDVAVAVAAPGATTPILSGVEFRLVAGDVCGVIGPSGAGKTSLARVLTGIWPAAKGTVRLDSSSLDQWDPDVRGRHIGYVAQTVELFDGTIAENIARMSPEADSAGVLAAAQLAGAHDMIVRLPGGYDCRIGDAGVSLSAGHRQRIGLARALYGDPFLIVLDEPNSNLDGEGEEALQRAIVELKRRRAIVVVIAHRKSSLIACDKALVLMNGAQKAFGPRDAVLAKVAAARPAANAATPANLRVVAGANSGSES
jgi:ATP-binding cassette, subfamily C, type I secretion system permease/ATPase